MFTYIPSPNRAPKHLGAQRKKKNGSEYQFEDNRPTVAAQRELQALAMNSTPKTEATPAIQRNNSSPILQRMVAIAHADDNTHQDYAVMKVVKELASRPDAGQIVDLKTGTIDFSQMQPTEKLYIAGHGNRDTGNIRGVDTGQLIAALTHHKRGVPAVFGGVVIMSCYGGLVRVGGSLASKVATGLRDKGKGIGRTVEGAKGYAFGSPKIGQHGKASVVDLALEDFYFLAPPSTLWHTWENIRPTHAGGVLTEKYPGMEVDTNKTIGVNITEHYTRNNLYPGEHITHKQADLIAMLQQFVPKAKAMEKTFSNILSAIPGETAHQKLDILRGRTQGVSGHAKLGNYVKRWEKLVKDQEALFHKFYIWKTLGDSFESVII